MQVLTRQPRAEAAVRWGVDPTTAMKLRRVAKEGALTALAAARPGRPRQPEKLGDHVGSAGQRLVPLTRTFPSGWPDLNRRPLDPQSSALTKLRHSPLRTV